jgi:hypothetical protein
VLCFALCCAVLRSVSAVLCFALCCAVLRSVSAVLCCAVLCFALCCAVLRSVSAVLCCAVLRSVLCCASLCLCCAVLCCGRYERAEEQLASTLEVESLSIYSSHKDDDDDDPSSAASGSISSPYPQHQGQGQQLANRKGTKKQKSKVSAEFERMGVRTAPSVAKAVDMIDAWTLITGRFLRHYPLLRMSFVLYLVLIHLWAIVILAVHTHSLDLE